MSRIPRPGPASIEGLRWLAHVGPSPLGAWRCAMRWSEAAARSHARRLEDAGWLARYPMTRAHGSLFVATRSGVAMVSIPVRVAGPPAPTWWAHHCGCAWTAASMTARGHSFLGPRELVEDRAWSGEISWRDRRGFNTSSHRPDLIGAPGQGQVAIEVELDEEVCRAAAVNPRAPRALARGRADQRRDLHLRRRGRQHPDRARGQGIRAPGVVTLMAPRPAARHGQSAGRSSMREAPSASAVPPVPARCSDSDGA